MPALGWSEYFDRVLQQVAAEQRLRSRRVLELDSVIDFGSNDYLGLRRHPAILALLSATTHLAKPAAWGAGASPLLSGYSPAQADLERALAEFAQSESALVFSSGYSCNSGTIACLATSRDLIVSDQLNHASLIDGCRLSRAAIAVYPHRNVDYVRELLQRDRQRYQRVLLLTESIFSMDGDAAPLQSLLDVADEFDCAVIVDEAHAVGVYGEDGSGLLQELGLQSRVLAKLGTLSKALGCVGGYIAGANNLIDFVINHCRSYMFSTAAPPVSLVIAAQALQLLREQSHSRQALRHQASALRAALSELGWPVPAGDSPIIPLLVGSEQRALQLSRQLWDAGIYVPAIRPPTVPANTCRLRISLSARHTQEDCQRLLKSLGSSSSAGL